MSPQEPSAEFPALHLANLAYEYATDLWQRGLLYADLMRERGNQYQEHLAQVAPNVLSFEAELIMSGARLERPVNYGLVRIIPPEGLEIDPRKRPFVVVDPRAGHGPGIGGFKAESEIGAALQAGHACYLVGFLPDPVPGQTVEDVMRAEAAFLERVIALHPDSEGKPVVIGNCQAGWQILMTAAVRPELFGPIILAGSPVSYWAGWPGQNPMRYSGGLLGGSWLTALTSDLGAGRFDGAWLVQNFENLNPTNTLWTKQYNLFSKVDTERERYLAFEKYWGGHVFLNDVEIQYIVDNLFVGNKLSMAQLITSDGIRIDLRNIKSPILVFCSKGDNISPPPQALGWITDLYMDDEDVRAHDQTIIYALHDSIGHLGIFVSGSIGRKEHKEFEANIDFLDVLPSGIYQAELREKGPDTLNPDLAYGDYVLSLEKRSVKDVREIVRPDVESDRRFAAVARISEINLSLYRSFAQPWVRAATTSQSARLLARLHPLRLSYELASDRNPGISWIASEAQKVRENRKPVSPDNPFLHQQERLSHAIQASLDQWCKWRDSMYEQTFNVMYGSPWVQAWAGMDARDTSEPRQHPGDTPEHRAFLAAEAERLVGEIAKGGVIEAGVRALYYIGDSLGWVDERGFNLVRRLREENGANFSTISLAEFKQAIRQQARLMRLDAAAAIAALPQLLSRAAPAKIELMGNMLERLLTVIGPLDEAGQKRLREVKAVLADAARQATTVIRPGPGALGAAVAPMHPYVDWAKERLDEIDATLASFESSVAKMQTEARAKAEKALTDIRGTRDAFRKSLAEHAQASETAFDQLKASLETRWTAFEADVQTFLDAAGKQAKEQEATFQARAEAQRKAWQESMDKLREAAASFTADRRADIETALKQMKTEADAAKVKFDKLNKASGESWAAMNSALTETRAAMDRANQAVYDAFKRAS